MAELSRRSKLSLSGVSLSVRRGEKIADGGVEFLRVKRDFKKRAWCKKELCFIVVKMRDSIKKRSRY